MQYFLTTILFLYVETLKVVTMNKWYLVQLYEGVVEGAVGTGTL